MAQRAMNGPVAPRAMNGPSCLVGHEQNVFPLVLHTRVRRSQVCLSKVDQIVLVLADDRLTAGAIEMRLH